MPSVTRRLFCATAVAAAAAPSFAASTSADDAVDFFRYVDVDNAGGVDRLLKKGFDPNTRDPKGQVGLYLALRVQSMKVVRVLVDAPGIQVDARNAADETPLMMAALRGESDAAQALIAHGALPSKDGWAPLHYAAASPASGAVAIVKLLLARGAPIEAHSPNGTTPLMMAAKYGTEDAVDALLAAGADRRAKNDQGLDAAGFAASAGRDNLAARLKADAASH
jgi:ankyrin repeat protein